MQNLLRVILKIGALFLLFSGLIFGACWSDKGKNIPDVSHIDVDIKIKRFEKDLMQLDTNHVSAGVDSLLEKYPVFAKELFLPKILPALQDTNVMALFLKSPGIQHLYDTLMIVFDDVSDIENEFESAFRFYKYYFPELPVPELVSFFSEYTIGTFTYEQEILGVGLDFFLGADYPLYSPEYFPRYIKRSMDKQHLVAKSMEAVASDLAGEVGGERLIDQMIHNGKILFLLDHFLPHTPDSIKLAYTTEQVAWCEANEGGIWAHFLTEDLLYSTRRKDIRKLVDHSPNSPGMPQEAPGRTANWLGWQIVKSYMKRNPKITFEELVANRDAQQILDLARYKPMR